MPAPLATASRAPLRAPLAVPATCGSAGRSDRGVVRRIGPFWANLRSRGAGGRQTKTPATAASLWTGERDLLSIATRSSHEWVAVLSTGAPCRWSDRVQGQVRRCRSRLPVVRRQAARVLRSVVARFRTPLEDGQQDARLHDLPADRDPSVHVLRRQRV